MTSARDGSETVAVPVDAAVGGAPPSSPSSRKDVRRTGSRRAPARWLRSAAERVPASWLTFGITGVLLVATAGFGGLERAASPASAELAAGAEHATAFAALTLERAVLIDALPEAGASPEDGDRVLAVVLTVESTWALPLETTTAPYDLALGLEALPELAPTSTARFDDTTNGPVLQPGVPAQLVTTWHVPADAFADGDDVRVTIADQSPARGTDVVYGDYWTDPAVTAVVTLPIDDVGAGADAGSGS